MAAKRRVEGEQALQPVVVDLLVEDVGDVHQENAQEIAHVLLAEALQRQAGHGERCLFAERLVALQRRRSPPQHRLQDAGIA